MSTILRAHRKASLTVEAALILPLFTAALLTLASVLLMYLTQLRMQALLVNTAQSLAISRSDGHNVPLSEVLNEYVNGLSPEDIRFIRNGRDGIDMSGSKLDDPEYIELSVRCDLVPLTGFFDVVSVPYVRSTLSHIWCGYESGFYPDDVYVYITNDSRVYHVDRQCSHIMLNIKKTVPEEVGQLRNDNGGRYRPCEICHAKLTDQELYITTDGDRYHNSITCSGLKRTVYAIRLSLIGDRRPCSRCGR